ncbi:MAG: RNA polymerase-binding protein DksA [Proteobacteria bacterium]|nr:RNA polymerase-binding protein DksA [Pseudomonadota bacterium]
MTTRSVKTAKSKEPKPTQAELGFLGIAPYELGKDEEYMNAKQLAHFRNILTKWKQQLMEEADTTVYHMKEDAALYPDPIDRASQEEGFNLELRTRDRERKLLKKIEQALDKIDKGEYGYCEDCGAEIGIRRLEARPTAIKCIDCKTFEEIRERQMTEE